MSPKHVSRRKVLKTGLGVAIGASASTFSIGSYAQSKPIPITIANAAGNVNLIMQELMKQQGFLEKMGLAPTIMNVADGGKMMGGIINGEIDCSTMSGFGQIFPAIEKGAKLKVLAGAALLPSLAVFTTKPEVKTLKDLEGKTVGTGSLGALLHQLMVALMKKHGVDVDKVRFVNIGASGDVFRAATMGTIDAGTGEVAVIEQTDVYKVRLVEQGNMSIELPEYTYQGAWASEQSIKTKREAIVRALAAYAQLYRFVHKQEALDAFLKARKVVFPNGTEADGMANWHYLQQFKPYASDLVVDDARMKYMQQLNVDLNVQTKLLPFDQVADMSLAQEALKML